MLNPLIAAFERANHLKADTVKDLQNIIKFQRWPKNTELLRLGQIARYLYFVEKGLARVYYLQDGKDVTDYFAIDGQFIGAVPSLVFQTPSHKAIHLLEDSDLYYFSSEDFEACCDQHHDLERAARRIMAFALMEEQQRIESLRFYSAKERYEDMERKYPGITNRCPLQYIASFIGTTPVSVSRIRAGIQ